VILFLACAAPEPPPLPAETTATDVVAAGPDWIARAPAVTVRAAVASTGEVAVAKTAPGKPPLEIAAARSDWDLRGRSARFEQDVVVTRGEVTMRCAKLEVRYADAETIDRVVATGGVTVTRGERAATAATAELEGATGRITLTGDPRLSEGPNTLAGERIVLWLDDERATCEGAAGSPCRLVVEGSALK
jgi:lipopolysaccharide export system protein LptA